MILTLTNHKGGVGKTTVCLAFGQGMIERKKRILFVDLDPQGSLTYALGQEQLDVTLHDVLTRKASIEEAIHACGSYDLLPGSMLLANAEALIYGVGKEYRLKELLDPIRANYDYIVIDTPPALNILTTCALTATDQVIIPLQAEALAVHGLSIFYETFEVVKKYVNPNIELTGILLTKHSGRTNLSRDITELIEGVAEKIGTRVFKTSIRESVKVREAQLYQESLYTYAPTSSVTEDCRAFIDEYLELTNVPPGGTNGKETKRRSAQSRVE